MSTKSEKTFTVIGKRTCQESQNRKRDLSALSRELVRLTVETALGKEMAGHLFYAKHSSDGHGTGNSRNGTSKRHLKVKLVKLKSQLPEIGKAHFLRNS